MPRQKRHTYLGFPHLIKAYASSETKLFQAQEDYEGYLLQLRQMVRDKYLRVYAFCLQESELRLIIKPTRMTLAKIIQRLHCSHTVRSNNKYDRKGHLFAGRFNSIVFPHEQILDVVRAVHLWPVRAGRVRRTETVMWSSHNCFLNNNAPWADMLETEQILDSLSSNRYIAQKAYARFIESGVLDSDNDGLNMYAPGIGGSGDGLNKLLQRLRLKNKPQRRLSLYALAQRVSLLLNVSVGQLQSTSRRQDIVMARRLLSTVAVLAIGRQVSEVADFVGRDKAQISRLVSQGVDLYDCDEPFKTLFESVRGNQSHNLNDHDNYVDL